MAVPDDLTTRWPTRNSYTTSVDSTLGCLPRSRPLALATFIGPEILTKPRPGWCGAGWGLGPDSDRRSHRGSVWW